MLARRKRLSRASFPAALMGGRRISTQYLNAVVSPSTEGYAIVVSKKVARLSVTRHRIKRRLAALLRSHTPSLPPSLILFPKTAALQLDPTHLQAALDEILARIQR